MVTFDGAGNPRALFGSKDWTDYELTCDAKKTGGAEGFLILYRVTDKNYFWVNIGGWANVRSGLEFGTIDGNKDSRCEAARAEGRGYVSE